MSESVSVSVCVCVCEVGDLGHVCLFTREYSLESMALQSCSERNTIPGNRATSMCFYTPDTISSGKYANVALHQRPELPRSYNCETYMLSNTTL